MFTPALIFGTSRRTLVENRERLGKYNFFSIQNPSKLTALGTDIERCKHVEKFTDQNKSMGRLLLQKKAPLRYGKRLIEVTLTEKRSRNEIINS